MWFVATTYIRHPFFNLPPPDAERNPEDESQLIFSLDQSVPLLQRDWLRFTRMRLRVDKPIPLPGPVTLLLKSKGGHVQGDLPPYEAFPIGGTNSVRGYSGMQ
jgi:outer membrane protein insertion porin family